MMILLAATALSSAPAGASPPAVWTTTIERESYGSTGPRAGGVWALGPDWLVPTWLGLKRIDPATGKAREGVVPGRVVAEIPAGLLLIEDCALRLVGRDGETRWTHAAAPEGTCHHFTADNIAQAGGHIFVWHLFGSRSPDEHIGLLTIDAATGDLQGVATPTPTDGRLTDHLGPILGAGDLLFRATKGRVYAADAKTGTRRWSVPRPGGAVSGWGGRLARAGDVLYVAELAEPGVQRLEAGTGRDLGPAAVEGRVAHLSADGDRIRVGVIHRGQVELVTLDRAGKPVWRRALRAAETVGDGPRVPVFSIETTPDRLYVVLDGRTVHVVGQGDGAVLGVLALGDAHRWRLLPGPAGPLFAVRLLDNTLMALEPARLTSPPRAVRVEGRVDVAAFDAPPDARRRLRVTAAGQPMKVDPDGVFRGRIDTPGTVRIEAEFTAEFGVMWCRGHAAVDVQVHGSTSATTAELVVSPSCVPTIE